MKVNVVPLIMAMPFYWLCLCDHFFVVSGICFDDQRSLLLQLKNNFTFPSESSNKLQSWNASDDCCKWIGVSCDKEGRVTGLDLSGESISGGFDNSSSLFSLQHLRILNLAANSFDSVLPSGFNKLKNLTYLNLSFAGFVGEITTQISQLTRLVTLYISSDPSKFQFYAAQKSEIPNLQKLLQNLTSIKRLNLDGVAITAPQQEWCKALLPLRDLQELSMLNCGLRGPLDPSLARLKNLSTIILDGNNFLSNVPETLANLKNLTILSLASCGLGGIFPQKIFQIGTLSVIDISQNFMLQPSFPAFPLSGSLHTYRVSGTLLFGALPHSIGNLRQLVRLDLHDCGLNGTLPNSLSNLTKLTILDLSSNSFTGPIPSSIGNLRRFVELDLHDCGLNGTLPNSLSNLTKLTFLGLSSNGFTGQIPSSLFTLPLLQSIFLSDNQFNHLSRFENVSSSTITTLDISRNSISGPFPISIFQFKALSSVILTSNKINGSVELNRFLELKNLTTLHLSYNKLTVNVNSTIADPSSFPNITNLKLASCSMKIFPVFLRNLSRLKTLDLSDNQIQGIVPNWIWKLENLEFLNFSHNLLTDLGGPLKNLSSNFIVLDLHHNQLQGTIPVLPIRDVADYSSNKFSSIIPQDIGNFLFETGFLSLSNNNFHGTIPESLCNTIDLTLLDLSFIIFLEQFPPV
ncbi:hypothetical protein RJT34_22283 [Clitoria ternatea]|uniref:Leucine-rich repeat-containing N-terminal plant-type domain-containing protein n=1 Tax=Clitoria ternatea TaxID=43366 RepID=A0AAN9IVI0_CLITE